MPLPDEGIKIAALPAASSPDAIDLVGVQAGVTKKLASTLLATQAELDTVNLAAAHLAGAETLTGAKTFTASETPFGTGAAGGAGAFVRIGDFGDAAKVELIAAGTGANIDFAARTKGTGVHRLKNGGGSDLLSATSAGDVTIHADTASGTQSRLLASFSFIGVRRLEAGAADSAGAGFRTVRIPN